MQVHPARLARDLRCFELTFPGEPIVNRIEKVVLLELRKEHLAVGYAMRRNTDIHFFDP